MNTSCCPQAWINFFKASGDHNRQHILWLISKHKSLNASDILSHLKLSQPTLSHHLGILKQAGLVIEKKQGREVFYSLNRKNISACCLGFMNKLSK